MPDRDAILRALHCRGQALMIDRPDCNQCDYRLEMPNGGGCDFRRLCRDAAELLKGQEEQKRKWLQAIADTQLAVSPTGYETEEGLARKTGEWNGLQMAWDILTEGR